MLSKTTGIVRMVFSAAFAACLISAPAGLAEEPRAGGALIFTHVHVVPMDRERVLDDMSVVVSDGKIVELGPAEVTAVPAGARVIEGRGRYLLPGLMDVHVHLGHPFFHDEEAGQHVGLFLAHGVTTIRNMHGSPEHLAFRDQVNRGELLGPTIFCASPMFPGIFAVSPEKAREGVRQFAEKGYDLVKIVRLPPEIFHVVMDEAAKVGIPVAGHLPNFDEPLADILGAGMVSVEHVAELVLSAFGGESDVERLPALVETVRKSGVMVSTLLAEPAKTASLRQDPEAFFQSEQARRAREAFGEEVLAEARKRLARYEARSEEERRSSDKDIPFLLRLVRALDDAGVGLLAGTDSRTALTMPGAGLHDELSLYIEAGLSPFAALRAATTNPARLLGILDRSGTVEVGKDADLILVEENPLREIRTLRRPVGVVLRGRWIGR